MRCPAGYKKPAGHFLLYAPVARLFAELFLFFCVAAGCFML